MRCLRCKGYVGGPFADCTCDTPVWTEDMLTPCGPPVVDDDQRVEEIVAYIKERPEGAWCEQDEYIAYLLRLIGRKL